MPSSTSIVLTPRCRICYDTSSSKASALGLLIRPCDCTGSIALIHSGCLNRWLENKTNMKCELCKVDFEVVYCRLKDFSEMSWPHPLGDDIISRFEFFVVGIWLIDVFDIVSHIIFHGTKALSLHLEGQFGMGWMFYVGTFCTIFNTFYYGAIFFLVIDQWLWENRLFVLKDRNTLREKELIQQAGVQVNKEMSHVTYCEASID